MTRLLPIIGFAFLLSFGLETASAQVAAPLTYRALPAQASPAQMPLQVRMYRLRNAEAAFVADELSALIVRPDVRIVGDARTNSVIVASPPAIQATFADLIARLDAAQVPGEPPAAASPSAAPGNVPSAGNRAVIVNALDQLLSQRGTLPQGSQIAVLRISPAAARALATVVQAEPAQQPQSILTPQVGQQPQSLLPSPPAQPQPGQQPMEYQALRPPLDGTSIEPAQSTGSPVRTLTISRDDVAALAKALRSLSDPSAKPGAVVVVPQQNQAPEVPAPPPTPAPSGAMPR